MEILKDVEPILSEEEINQNLHLRSPEDIAEVQALLHSTKSCFKGQVVYKVSFIEAKLEDSVILDGIQLTSRVLRRNLDNAERVFPYVLTIGEKLEKQVRATDDLLEQFRLDVIGTVALNAVRRHLANHLCNKFALKQISYMSPGSLSDWPMEEQKYIFSLLGGVEEAIGVKLNESLLMIPKKSLSGIVFPTKIPFQSCQLCPRKGCPSRKAPFDKSLTNEYGISAD